jgi:hypothetical protein
VYHEFCRTAAVAGVPFLYDIVSCLLQEYAQLFQYKGVKTDNHIREHDIYSMALKFLPFIRSSMSAEVGRNMTCP